MFNYRNISKKSNYLKKNKDVRITLDAKHNEQITKLRLRQKNIPLLLLKLKRNIQKLDMVDNINKREFKQAPPNPFDLTSLQIEAFRCFRISPKETLQIAQELYSNS
jgi:DNA topoisomerase IA